MPENNVNHGIPSGLEVIALTHGMPTTLSLSVEADTHLLIAIANTLPYLRSHFLFRVAFMFAVNIISNNEVGCGICITGTTC